MTSKLSMSVLKLLPVVPIPHISLAAIPETPHSSLLLIWQMFSSLCPYMKIASTYLSLPIYYSSTPGADSYKGKGGGGLKLTASQPQAGT
ncbi:hypothetical protein GDO81_012861 [Engystomops pustulosus]|uniref:Uncharacterized protein n=1 Tax=Engystomops pustulosus TaxID=76066 RepID=A0AAV7AV90_ENGPU|nr:hypothetical protein GDO81_012861 [Engystomops pustulosus]